MYGMVCMVWYGMVWYGVAWFGIVWYDIVWCCVVSCRVVLYCIVSYCTVLNIHKKSAINLMQHIVLSVLGKGRICLKIICLKKYQSIRLFCLCH